jgi:hypothetical protein
MGQRKQNGRVPLSAISMTQGNRRTSERGKKTRDPFKESEKENMLKESLFKNHPHDPKE